MCVSLIEIRAGNPGDSGQFLEDSEEVLHALACILAYLTSLSPVFSESGCKIKDLPPTKLRGDQAFPRLDFGRGAIQIQLPGDACHERTASKATLDGDR